MPNPKVCNRIKDPAARQRCLQYQGEFSQQGNTGTAGRSGRMGGGAQRRSPGGRSSRPTSRFGGGGLNRGGAGGRRQY